MSITMRALLAFSVFAASQVTAQASGVLWLGTISGVLGTNNGPYSIGDSVYFNPNWNPAPGVAGLTHAFFIVNGTDAFSAVNAGTAEISSAGPDQLTVNVATGFSDTSIGGNTIDSLVFTQTRTGPDENLNGATDANLNAILTTSTNTGGVAGTFQATGAGGTGIYQFSGSAVPEPASLAMVGCFGAVFGFGMLRRRRQKNLVAATE